MHVIIMLLLTVAAPLICMNSSLDNDDRVVKFVGDFSVICVEKSHLPLIKTLYGEYQEHKKIADKGGIVPSSRYVSTKGLSLINEALKVRPDEFKRYYNTLLPENRTLLIKASGQYDDDGKKVMFDVPEITKRLVDVYFPEEGVGLCTYIKSFIGNEDEDYVRNYCKEQLIRSKGIVMLKQPMLGDILNVLHEKIYPGSLFINGYFSCCQYKHPIPLYADGRVHQTYAMHFVNDSDEYRITDINDKQCLLWVINHAHPDATFSTPIKHEGAIQGCCFSKTRTEVECALTYSESDMVFSAITMDKRKTSVNSTVVAGSKNGIIVSACFDPVNNEFLVASYEGVESRVRRYTMYGVQSVTYSSWQFIEHGLLRRIVTYQQSDKYYLAAVFSVAQLWKIDVHESLNGGGYNMVTSTELMSASNQCPFGKCGLVRMGNMLYEVDFSAPFFVDNSVAQRKQEQEIQKQQKHSFFGNLENLYDGFVSKYDNFVAQPDSEVHRVYSPDGSFLMCNSLISKLGIWHVRTAIKDAVTHKEILSIDSLYNNFAGVGFTHNGTELIFLNHGNDLNFRVALLNDEDKKMLCAIDDVACTNLGVASLIKRLCMECRAKGTLPLHEDGSTCKMLIDWARKSPMLLKVLEKCLPLTKIKK